MTAVTCSTCGFDNGLRKSLLQRMRRSPPVVCSSCGAENSSGSKFCNSCGARLTRESQAASAPVKMTPVLAPSVPIQQRCNHFEGPEGRATVSHRTVL